MQGATRRMFASEPGICPTCRLAGISISRVVRRADMISSLGPGGPPVEVLFL